MILIDSNVPMYLIGAAHPNKVAAQRVLERLVANRVRLVTDAEVFQEIICICLLYTSDAVVLGRHQLSARDAIHAAVMMQHQIPQIMSFDAGFDGLPGIERIWS